MILTYDKVSKIILSGEYLLYYFDVKVVHTILGHLDLDMTSGLISRFFVSGAYLLYYG